MDTAVICCVIYTLSNSTTVSTLCPKTSNPNTQTVSISSQPSISQPSKYTTMLPRHLKGFVFSAALIFYSLFANIIEIIILTKNLFHKNSI